MLRIIAFTLAFSSFLQGAEIANLLETHCIRCHGGEKQKGEVDLRDIHNASPELWENVVAQIEDGEMPPEDEPPMADGDAEAISSWVEHSLAALETVSDPGRTTLRRLNRLEYRNTVHDLFGVDFNPSQSFPADGAGGEGFNNNADALFLSPVLMEKYLGAAGDVVGSLQKDARLWKKFTTAARKSDPPEASHILHPFLSRAFRRPVSQDEIELYSTPYKTALASGEPFDSALGHSLRAILISPHFLFRVEKPSGKDGTPSRLSDFEIASRLSYFLWASMPDAALFAAARKGELAITSGITKQVDRMLQGRRARSLANAFAGQWIGFEALIDAVEPDKERFPEFTPTLRAAMYREGSYFFYDLLKTNAPLTDLLHSDYTFVNEPLAKLYGIPGIKGKKMQKVSLEKHPERGGVLGMAGLLTATSLPLRTSPVVRGKWVLENILGTPPPPPPQDAGELPADDKLPGGLTFRERLEQHRQAKTCAGCHAKIDPIGFGLENFDAIGRWRTEAHGSPVDPTGTLPDGTRFTGPQDLRKNLLARKSDFITHATRSMLSYATGRGILPTDRKTIKEIVSTLESEQYRTRSLVRAVATSYPFTHSKN